MSKLIKLLKENVIIVIPAVVVSLSIIGFFIFGFLDPSTKEVDYTPSIIEYQHELEAEFMAEYNQGNYTETRTFFELDPYQISPLSGLLMFETTEETSYFLVINGITDDAEIEFITTPATSHRIPVYGLYPDRINTIELYENIEGVKGELVSQKVIQTSPVPEGINETVLINTTYEYFQDDIMILIPATKSLPVGYDFDGDVRWYLTENLTFAPVLLESGRMLIGSNLLMSDPYYVTALYEIDYLGKVYTEYKIPGGYHHDALELPNGNILALSNDFNGTVEDIIVEIDDESGDIVNEWDLKDILNQTQGQSAMWTAYDWFHNNSVDFNPETNEILLSGRHQDIVISIDYDTSVINYIIGDPENWGQFYQDTYFLTPTHPDFEWQYAQHSAIFTPEGIFIFDNGNNKSKLSENYIDIEDAYSRGVMYQVDVDTMEITQTYQFGKERGTSFYSPYISNVQYLGEANYLIHSGGYSEAGGVVLNVPAALYEGEDVVSLKSTTIEILDGEIVYELVVIDNYYQALHTSLYTDNTRFISGKGLSLGELAETPTYSDAPDFDFNFFETVPPKYEVTFTKENDRLVFNGVFNRYDDIYLILRNEFGDTTYSIPTSNTAYTAMCIGTFLGDDRELIFYVNETNMTGYYEIYLVVNDTEYNTYKHVVFD